jgi:diguanylate cyclase (GGDEF)-like protein
VHERIEWEKQLLETARHLTATLEVKAVLGQIAATARDILRAYGCALYLLDPDAETLTPVVAIEPPYEEEVLSTPLSVETSFTGQAVKARRGLIFNDARSSPLGQQIPGTPEEEEERVVVAPFIVDDKVIGAMCLKRVGALFTEEELALSETFATYAATALKNAQTHRDLRHEVEERTRAEEALAESKRKIEDLHRIARRLEACQNEDEVYRLTVDAAERILGLSISHMDVALGDKLVTKAASSGFPPEACGARNLAEGLAGQTYRAGKTHIFDKPEEIPKGVPARESFKSAISAPVGGIGVFQAFSRRRHGFTPDDERMLELLLGHTAESVRRIRLQDSLREQAIHDPLTAAYNRHYLSQALAQETTRSRRHNRPIAFLMIDVDDLKGINDRFGHQTGDRVLQAVASLLCQEVRETDTVVRYGGDEFLVIMPETGDEAEVVGERIRQKAGRLNELVEKVDCPISLSIGIAYWRPHDSVPVEQILSQADNRMYRDKRSAHSSAPSEPA